MSEVRFREVTIAPFELLGESWNRVRDQYGLFLAITTVGLLVGSMAPLGILLGPMMCGVYLCYFEKQRGRAVQFDMLFRGFDVFVESLIATLLSVGAIFAAMLPAGLLLALGFVAAGAAREAPGPVLLLIGGMAALLFFGLTMAIAAAFVFVYPLIVDRRLPGVEAVKLSARAALANVWGLLGLVLATTVLGVVGMCFCYVGAFLVLPVSLGAIAIVYERVFGLAAESPLAPVALPGR